MFIQRYISIKLNTRKNKKQTYYKYTKRKSKFIDKFYTCTIYIMVI